MLLCEVALGKINELFAADYNADRLPKNKQSVKGVGMFEKFTKIKILKVSFVI